MTNRSQLSDNSKNIKIMMLYPGNIDASKFIENIKKTFKDILIIIRI